MVSRPRQLTPYFSCVSQILDEIAEHGIRIYQLPDADSDEDEEFKEQTRVLKVREGHRTDVKTTSDTSVCWFSDRYHSLPIHPCFPSPHPLLSDTFIFHISFRITSSDFVSLWGSTDLYLPFPGEHSLCCDWLQPADWGEGEEDPWSSLPLGSCWSGEPRAQWLPQTTHHACVSLPGNKTASVIGFSEGKSFKTLKKRLPH